LIDKDARTCNQTEYAPEKPEIEVMKKIHDDALTHYAQSVFSEIWKTQSIVLPAIHQEKFPGARFLGLQSFAINGKI
jgi:hypothetical protein